MYSYLPGSFFFFLLRCKFLWDKDVLQHVRRLPDVLLGLKVERIIEITKIAISEMRGVIADVMF